MAAAGVTVAHNARSNGKAGRGIAPVAAMRAAGIPVGIATDGPMSGNTLDLFAQFAPVSMFPSCRAIARADARARRDPHGHAEGARGAGPGRPVGTLEVRQAGRPDPVSWPRPALHPVYDIYATLVFSAMAPDVRDVMVAGRWLMRDRAVLTLEPAQPWPMPRNSPPSSGPRWRIDARPAPSAQGVSAGGFTPGLR
jgi:5-methylthioadenosine/S-adenosylhomocysteine deaminase